MYQKTETRPSTVSEIVRADYRTADVFKKWGINYCCGGNLPLQDACAVKNVSLSVIESDLREATKNIQLSNVLQFDKWPLVFLVEYILHVHHAYVKHTIPPLRQLLASFVSGHNKKYPYLAAVEEAFAGLSEELLQHTSKEEESIFPYVKQISYTYERREAYGALFVRTMRKPLAETISKEHDRINALLLALREQAANYTYNDDACTNHRVIYHKLKEFDDDLVQHMHLENNILFPKVLEMEKSLLRF